MEKSGNEARPSQASARRLSLYLRRLEDLFRGGTIRVSSGRLGKSVNITDAQVRKDLACLGNLGQPGIGYATSDLIQAIRHRLGIDRSWTAALVGVGNLARALLRYRGFPQRDFRIAFLFDSDHSKIGATVDGLRIHSTGEMQKVMRPRPADLGIITVPAEEAQQVTDQLVAAGIRGILNFAPAVIFVPRNVSLLSVDLTVQLEQLAFMVQMQSDP